MNDPDSTRTTIAPEAALKAARALARRASDGEEVTLTPEAGEALHAALFDLRGQITHLKKRLEAAERREIADREIVLGEEAARSLAEKRLTQSTTHLTACAYASDSAALGAALVAARAWLRVLS